MVPQSVELSSPKHLNTTKVEAIQTRQECQHLLSLVSPNDLKEDYCRSIPEPHLMRNLIGCVEPAVADLPDPPRLSPSPSTVLPLLLLLHMLLKPYSRLMFHTCSWLARA